MSSSIEREIESLISALEDVQDAVQAETYGRKEDDYSWYRRNTLLENKALAQARFSECLCAVIDARIESALGAFHEARPNQHKE